MSGGYLGQGFGYHINNIFGVHPVTGRVAFSRLGPHKYLQHEVAMSEVSVLISYEDLFLRLAYQ